MRVTAAEMRAMRIKSLERKRARKAKGAVLWKKSRVRSARSIIVAKLDNMFSLFIRIRDKKKFNGMCPFCSKRPIECCFHVITRAKYAVRWDPRNAVGSCHACNYRNEYDPHSFVAWYIKQNGVAAFKNLVLDSNLVSKRSNEDLLDLLGEMRSAIERGVEWTSKSA